MARQKVNAHQKWVCRSISKFGFNLFITKERSIHKRCFKEQDLLTLYLHSPAKNNTNLAAWLFIASRRARRHNAILSPYRQCDKDTKKTTRSFLHTPLLVYRRPIEEKTLLNDIQLLFITWVRIPT